MARSAWLAVTPLLLLGDVRSPNCLATPPVLAGVLKSPLAVYARRGTETNSEGLMNSTPATVRHMCSNCTVVGHYLCRQASVCAHSGPCCVCCSRLRGAILCILHQQETHVLFRCARLRSRLHSCMIAWLTGYLPDSYEPDSLSRYYI